MKNYEQTEIDYNKEHMTQWFDEMNLLKSEKRQRVQTAQAMYERIGKFFEEVYEDILLGLFMFEKDRNYYLNELIEIYLGVVERTNKTILSDTDVNVKADVFARQIQDTNERLVARSDDSEYRDFANAVRMGIKVDEATVPWWVTEELKPDNWRALQTAENESNWIHNYIRHKDIKEQGQLTHTWETMKDEKVRSAHAVADGQTVPIDEPFIIGGYKMMYPMDALTSPGIPADLILGCRCVEI